jgi:hypothetical protein
MMPGVVLDVEAVGLSRPIVDITARTARTRDILWNKPARKPKFGSERMAFIGKYNQLSHG